MGFTGTSNAAKLHEISYKLYKANNMFIILFLMLEKGWFDQDCQYSDSECQPIK